jgi:2-isopropylmalate synthase
MHVPRNKAVVGENAFAHEAGIHQHGMLQHRSTYEIMRPEDVGFSKSNLVLGKHSGRHAFRMRVRELGFDLDEFETNRAFQEFKKLADRKKDMYDGDIEAIVLNVDSASGGPWTLQSLQVTSGTGRKASAAITLIDDGGSSVEKSAAADGPAEAVFRALELATEIDPVLKSFDLHSATSGEDAQAEATVVVDYGGQTFRGHGTSTDIVEAGGRAYLEVINRILRRRERGNMDPATIGDINQASI